MSSTTQRTLWTIIAVVIAAAVLLPLLALAFSGGGGTWGGMMGGGWMFMGLPLLVIIIVVVLLIAGEERKTAVPAPLYLPQPGTTGALAQLDLRYARGELSQEEYWRIRRDLEAAQQGGSAPPQR